MIAPSAKKGVLASLPGQNGGPRTLEPKYLNMTNFSVPAEGHAKAIIATKPVKATNEEVSTTTRVS